MRFALMLMTVSCLTSIWAAAQPFRTGEDATEYVRSLYVSYDFQGAEEAGRRLMEQFPNAHNLRAWSTLAMSLTGGEDEALAAAEKFVEEYPGEPWAYWALATTATWHGDHDERALEVSESAFARRLDHPDFVWMRAWALRYHDRDTALPFLSEHDAVVQGDPVLLGLKSTVTSSASWQRGSRDQAMADEALEILEDVRTRFPDYLGGYYLAASQLSSARRNEEALQFATHAAKLSPDATGVHLTYWRVVAGQPDLSEAQKRQLIEGDILAMRERRPNSLPLLQRAKMGYDLLGDKEGKRRLEDQILAIGPESSQAEWVRVERYRAFAQEMGREGWTKPDQRAEYRALLLAFLDSPVIHNERLRGDAYRGLYRTLRADSMAADPDQLLEAVEGMVLYEGINPHITFAQGPMALADRRVHFARAAEIAVQGVEEGKKKIDEQNERKLYETEGDYQNAVDWMTSMMVDALGWVYFREGRLEDAERELLRAHELNQKLRDNLFHLGQLYEALDEQNPSGPADSGGLPATESYLESAESFYIKGMEIQMPGSNPSDAALRALYERRTGSLAGVEDYMASLDDIDRVRRKEKILGERLKDSKELDEFDLARLAGGRLSSKELDGKVVVINAWGTWCGPCVIEMPGVQEVADKYRDDEGVVVLTINNDTNPDLVRQFMTKHEYEFTVLLDDGYLNRNDVFAYPTTWFVGPTGRVEFIKRGWSDDLAEEFSWRVDALRN